MKRALFGILTAVLILGTSTMSVSAAGSHHGRGGCDRTYYNSSEKDTGTVGRHSKWKLCCDAYCDEDCDGYCDNCGGKACCGAYCDEDRDGCCDNCGAVCRVYKSRGAGRKGSCHGRCHR